MVLQDWKETSGDYGDTVWTKGSGEGQKKVILKRYASENEYEVRVNVAHNPRALELEEFKNKPQAMAFAKNYMRNH